MDAISYVISVPLRLISLVISLPLVLGGKLYDLVFKKKPEEPHTILITGASSGICKEVAIQYAKPGNTLILVARNMERLNAVAEIVREKGAEVTVASIDVLDAQKIRDFVHQQDDLHPIDLLIAGAGAVTPSNNASYAFSDLYDYVLKANVTTCYNTVLPIVDRMRERRCGQICIFSSVAGLGINFISPLYSSAKIAVQGFGEALQTILPRYGVHVSLVCPGYTQTPILDTNTGKDMNWILDPKDVAAMVIDGLRCDYAVIECNMAYNLGVSSFVQYIPKLARDYLFQMIIPIAKRYGLFLNEYPSFEAIYNKEKTDSVVCFAITGCREAFPYQRYPFHFHHHPFSFLIPYLVSTTLPCHSHIQTKKCSSLWIDGFC